VVDLLRSLRGPGESFSDVICGWRQRAANSKILARKERRGSLDTVLLCVTRPAP
jgi:hypothetical protein